MTFYAGFPLMGGPDAIRDAKIWHPGEGIHSTLKMNSLALLDVQKLSWRYAYSLLKHG